MHLKQLEFFNLKAIIISSEFPPGPGGIGQHAFSMALAFKGQVMIIANQDYADSNARMIFNDSLPKHINFIPFASRERGFTSVKRIIQVFTLIEAHKPDRVVVSGRFPLIIGGLIKLRFPHRQVIGIVHGTEISSTGGILSKLTAFFYRRLDRIVAVSHFSARLLDSKTDPQKIKIVPNGLDASTLELSLSSSEPFEGHPALLTVGNITPRKGQHRVVKAMPAILSKSPSAHYHIVGLPTYSESILKLALKLHVEKAMTIHGRIANHEDLLAMYTRADIFIMLSENQSNGDVEGFGIAILEANAFGIPAIGARGCGIEDAISSDSGLLVDGDNTTEIAEAIDIILHDYERFSKGARAWAEKHNWDSLIKQIIA